MKIRKLNLFVGIICFGGAIMFFNEASEVIGMNSNLFYIIAFINLILAAINITLSIDNEKKLKGGK